MNKEDFLSVIIYKDRIQPKRLTEAFLKRAGVYSWLIENTPDDFISISDKAKYQVYGGGYCLTCGTRTNVAASGKGFASYCKEHFHDAKKGRVAHNRSNIDEETVVRMYRDEKKSLKEIVDYFGSSFPLVHKILEDSNVEVRTHSEAIKLTAPKAKSTNNLLYGVDWAFQAEEVKKRIRESHLKRRGVEYPTQCQKVRDTMRDNFIKKHGVDNPGKLPDHKEKSENTSLSKYGVSNFKYVGMADEGIRLLRNPDLLQEELKTKTIDEISKESKLSRNTIRRKIYDHGLVQHKKDTSVPESELFEFLLSNYPDITRCRRDIIKGHELDIFIPQYNVAIEFNGVYWHSERGGKDRWYHWNKTNACLSNGVKLIHVYEDEWDNQKEAVMENLLDIISKNFDRNGNIVGDDQELVFVEFPSSREVIMRKGVWMETQEGELGYVIWNQGNDLYRERTRIV